MSGGRGNSELYLYNPAVCKKLGKKVFKQLTNNKRHNVSPCVLPDNNVIFCSNYGSSQPQIHYLDMKTKNTRRITNGRGYCAAPSYCAKTNDLVYIRSVRGVFQLFTISLDNMNSIKETQVTKCAGNKQEPSWSECGRYIIFSVENGKKTPQIAVMNYKSGKVRVMTHDSAPKSFPRWTNQLVWA